jgi:hypothetical protein
MNEEQPIPQGFKQLVISAEEMDYLCHKFEIRDHRDLFSWGVKLLYDIAKAEEQDWHMTLMKGKVEEGIFKNDGDYRFAAFCLEWLAPSLEGHPRIDADLLEKKMKVN